MRKSTMRNPVAAFFQDNKGKIVAWQWPNAALYGWLLCKVASMVADTGDIKDGFAKLGTAFLFAWAYMEITKGASYFRQVLGLAVIIMLILSYFK